MSCVAMLRAMLGSGPDVEANHALAVGPGLEPVPRIAIALRVHAAPRAAAS
jgi:hypothetical protein